MVTLSVLLRVLVIKIQPMQILMSLKQVLFQRKNFPNQIKILFIFLYVSDMPGQANLLVERMTNTLGASRFASEWKLVTFFIGGNDLCAFCKDTVCIIMKISLEI
jgi:hypothetical protein